MNESFKKLGKPEAINRFTTLVPAFFVFAGTFVSARADNFDRIFLFTAIDFVAVLPFIFTLAFGRLVLNHIAKEDPKPYFTLIIFLVAIIARAITLDYLLLSYDFTDQSLIIYRIFLSLFGVLAGTVMIAIIVIGSIDLSNINKNLVAKSEELSEIREEKINRISTKRQKLINDIRNELLENLRQFEKISNSSNLDLLNAFIDDFIKPFSRRLVSQLEPIHFQKPMVTNSKVELSQALKISQVNLKIYALPSNFWLASATLAFLFPTYGLLGLWSGIFCFIVGLVLLLTANSLLERKQTNFSLIQRATLLSAIFFLHSILHYGAMSLFTPFEDLKPNRFIPLAVVVFLIDWMTSIAFSFYRTQEKLNLELSSLNYSLKQEVIVLNRLHRKLRLGVARVLHGPIQDGIVAVIYKNKYQINESSVQDVLAQIQTTIEASVVKYLETEQQGKSLESQLLDLQTLWTHSAVITFDLDPTVNQLTKADPSLKDAVIEVTREAISNAIRHANSSEIQVEISTKSNDQLILISVINEAKKKPKNSRTGLGTQMFDELTIQWDRKHSLDRTFFTALIPVKIN